LLEWLVKEDHVTRSTTTKQLQIMAIHAFFIQKRNWILTSPHCLQLLLLVQKLIQTTNETSKQLIQMTQM